MSDSLNLYRLQMLDTRLGAIESRQKEIKEILESNKQLFETKSNLANTAARKDSLSTLLKKREKEAIDKKIKIQQSESSLYGGAIQNPKELQGLQLELDSLRKQLTLIEDQELDNMLALEAAQKEYSVAADQYENTLKETGQENSRLIDEKEKLQKEADRLALERRAAADSIDSKTLTLYDEIRSQRHGIAVTTMSDGSCDSCGAVLTPAQQQSAHHSRQLFRCPSCGRIIYS